MIQASLHTSLANLDCSRASLACLACCLTALLIKMCLCTCAAQGEGARNANVADSPDAFSQPALQHRRSDYSRKSDFDSIAEEDGGRLKGSHVSDHVSSVVMKEKKHAHLTQCDIQVMRLMALHCTDLNA